MFTNAFNRQTTWYVKNNSVKRQDYKLDIITFTKKSKVKTKSLLIMQGLI